MADLQAAVAAAVVVGAGRKAPSWCVVCNPLVIDSCRFVQLQVSDQAADELIYMTGKRANCINLVYCSGARLFGGIVMRAQCSWRST